MINIRPLQSKAFECEIHGEYVRNLATYIRHVRERESSQYSDDDLIVRIENAVNRAKIWDCVTSDGIARFVELEVLLGGSFIERPEVIHLAAAPGLSADMKIHLLVDTVDKNIRNKLTSSSRG